MNILQAAKDVVERWDTPLWKDVPATAEYINRLRHAIEEMEKAEPVAWMAPHTKYLVEPHKAFHDWVPLYPHPAPENKP